jgi:hypothetical protein
MAATPGQQIQDRCHRDVMWHYFLCRPDREAGAKTRGSQQIWPLKSQPLEAVTLMSETPRQPHEAGGMQHV